MPSALANSADMLNGLVQLNEPPDQLSADEVVIEKHANAGRWGTEVYRGTYKGQSVAIKVLRLMKEGQPLRISHMVEREFRTWWLLKHENILPLHGYIDKPNLSSYRVSVAPWCAHGNLEDFMRRHPKMGMNLRTALLCGIVNGIQYLHTLSAAVVHGNISPRNILIDDTHTPILCDFVLCRVIHDGAPSPYEETENYLGTTRYMAPEFILNAGFSRLFTRSEEPHIIRPTTQGDIWALGCVTVELIAGMVPYSHVPENSPVTHFKLMNEIKSDRPPAKRPSNTRGVIRDLWKEVLEPCWKSKPKQRPTIQQISSFINQRRIELELLDYSLEERREIISTAISSFLRPQNPSTGSTIVETAVNSTGTNKEPSIADLEEYEHSLRIVDGDAAISTTSREPSIIDLEEYRHRLRMSNGNALRNLLNSSSQIAFDHPRLYSLINEQASRSSLASSYYTTSTSLSRTSSASTVRAGDLE